MKRVLKEKRFPKEKDDRGSYDEADELTLQKVKLGIDSS